MTVHRLHGHGQDPEIAHIRDTADALAGRLYDAEKQVETLTKQLEAADRYTAHVLARLWQAETERDKALDYAQREQAHRLDLEGTDRLLRDIERMDVLQHGGDEES